MIISDLNLLEVVEAAEVVGGVVFGSPRTFVQNNTANSSFNSTQNALVTISDPRALGNAASAGAKADAYNPTYGTLFTIPTKSFSNAQTYALADFLGGSTSESQSIAVINV